MYIEEELFNWIDKRCNKANFGITEDGIMDILENCGIWSSFEGIKYETEDFNMALEDCFRNYWYIVDDDRIRFTDPDSFAEDLDKYLGL